MADNKKNDMLAKGKEKMKEAERKIKNMKKDK